MNKKSIFAIIGIILLVAMYVVTLVCAIIKTPFATSMLMASLYCTIVIPVFIYGVLLITKHIKNRNNDDDNPRD